MSIFLYFLFSLFSSEDDVVTYEIDPRIHRNLSYDFRDFQDNETDKRIKWESHKQVIYIDTIDENLFDERVTPPLTLYVGKVRPILKSSSFENANVVKLNNTIQ
jgi:hypothetical protein